MNGTDERPTSGDNRLEATIRLISAYFDSCKVGCAGNSGFRKTTDLSKFSACLGELAALGIVNADKTVFADLGCGDGRVNLLAGYYMKLSIGIEIDPEILAEYGPRRADVHSIIEREGGIAPRNNIMLFQGSSLNSRTFEKVREKAGVAIGEVDLFYTYITLHDVFAELIAEHGRPGAYFLVYGFSKVLPRYDNFDLVIPDVGSQGIAALFRKPACLDGMPRSLL
ncbi:MAG: hypothetical protein AAGU11_01605 [Syntrophobacteraceae bacterium]